MNTSTATPHQGRNVKRIREILCIKQDALAMDLGISQQAVSLLEQREIIDAPTLDKVAKVLGVSKDAIENFSEEATVNFISNTFTSNDNSMLHSVAHQYNFNPIEKIVSLYDEKMALYERMLQLEKEKVAMLENLLNKK